MPDYTIEVQSKTIYGPFTYVDGSRLKKDFTEGKLNLSEVVLEGDQITRVAVKEVKEKAQKGLF